MPETLTSAWRSLTRAPAMTLAMALILAVGVGGNTMLLGVLDQLLLQAPAGVRAPDRVVRLYSWRQPVGAPVRHNDIFSAPAWAAFARADTGRVTVAAVSAGPARLEDGSRKVMRAHVSTNFFSVLGARPALGSFGAIADAGRDGSPMVAVLSHSLWIGSYGADSSIVGKSIRIDSVAFTVVGVAQRGFTGIELDADELWVPMDASPNGGEGGWRENVDSHWLSLIARIDDRAAVAGVEATLTAHYRSLLAGQRWFKPETRIGTAPLQRARSVIGLEGNSGTMFSLLLRIAAVATIVFLLAIANVASLQLLRLVRRRREIAVRLALGSSRRRLLGQAAVESAMLAAVAWAFSFWIATVGGAAVRASAFATIRWSTELNPWRLALLSAALTALAAFIAGLLPAFLTLRASSIDALRMAPGAEDPRGARWRGALLVLQLGLCMTLLPMAGAFVQSLRHATTLDRGFEPEGIVSIDASGSGGDYAPAYAMADDVRKISGVMSVAAGTAEGHQQQEIPDSIVKGGVGAVRREKGESWIWPTDPALFATVGLKIVSGRALLASDRAGAEKVAVITEALARRYWPAGDALSSCALVPLSLGECFRIVGVMRDLRWTIADTITGGVLIPAKQLPVGFGGANSFTVRFSNRPTSAQLGLVRDAVARHLGDRQFRSRAQLVTERLEPQLRSIRLAGVLFSAFGLLALVGAAAGVFSLVAFEARSRMRELGIRAALGASPSRIVRVVLRSSLRFVVAGTVLGLGVAWASGRLVESFLFEAHVLSAPTFAVTATLLFVAATSAALFPALRASRVDPVVVLRAE